MTDKENDATRLWEVKITSILAVLFLCNILYSCTPKDAITPKGIKIARLGKEMPTSPNPYPNYQTRDTLFQEEGYAWPAWMIEMKAGKVWVEGDFSGGETINRIRVETPEYAFKKRIRVGDSLAELYEVEQKWEATYIRSYGKVDIACKGVHFLVDKSAIPTAFQKGTDPATIIDANSVDKTAIIESIVVF